MWELVAGSEWRRGVGAATEPRAAHSGGDGEHLDGRRDHQAIAAPCAGSVFGRLVGGQPRRRPAPLHTRSARLGTLKP